VNVWKQWQRPRMEAYWGVVSFSIFYVIFEAVLVARVQTDSPWWVKSAPVVIGLFYTLLGGGLLYRVIGHAKMLAHEDGLIISNPFRSDQTLSWSEIEYMSPDRLLIIHRHDGTKVVAWVIQKNGWSRWRHIRREADQAIDDLGAFATRARGVPTVFARGASHVAPTA
jgi:uncharacterized integral membrane protein